MRLSFRFLTLGIAFALLAGASGATAQIEQNYNLIGIYRTQDANPANVVYNGTPGSFTAYVVIQNPRNFNLGSPGSGVERDISVIGGFEFKIVLPGSVFLLGATLPPNSTNFSSPPNFVVGTNLPVVNSRATCLTLNLGAFSQVEGYIFLSPVDHVPSIPGGIALTDFNDDFRLNRAYPASGSFAEPVFGLWPVNWPPRWEPDWTITISGSGDTDNILGVGPDATDGYDSALETLDSNPAVTFRRPEWGAGGGDFNRDFRAAYDLSADTKTWDFVVNLPPSMVGQYVTLEFAHSFGSSALPGMSLFDHGSRSTTLLGPDLSYRFRALDTSLDFSLTVGNVQPPVDEVRVQVSATINGMNSGTINAGVHVAATDGYDGGLDVPKPAPPPGDYVAASFEHDGWPFGPRFSHDIRSPFDPLAEGKTWPIMIETDQTGTLQIAFSPGFGEQVPFILHDLQTNEFVSLFPDRVYSTTTMGPGVLRFEMSIGGELSPPLTPASKPVAAGWTLVAPPLIPRPGFDSLNGIVLDQVPGFGYIFDYTPGSGYGLLDGSETATVGDGFWLATDSEFTWEMVGSFAYDSVRIPLAPGWNLFGYPLWFTGNVDGIRVSADGVSSTWAAALDAGWVSGVVGYDSVQDDYLAATELQPWTGYWVAALRSDVSITFSWLNFLGGKSATAKSSLERPPLDQRWRTVVTLDDGSGKTRSAVFGADALATDGFDAAYDLPRPPAAPSGGASLTLVRPAWKLLSGDAFAADIIAPLDGREVEWRLRITPHHPGTVTLDWSNRRWPDGQDFQLYVPSENRVIVMSMRNQDRVELEVGSQPLDVIVRTPNFVSGVGDEIPFAGYGLAAHPNPFNPSTTLSFALPREGRAEVRIYSVRGELVAELGGAVMAAGPQQFTWRGTDRAGRSVPSGSYFARLLVDGEHVGETAKMSLIR